MPDLRLPLHGHRRRQFLRAAQRPGEGRKQSVSRFVFLLVLAAALRPGAAAAHPHVFIDNRVTFILADQKITGFRENWLFDEVFSDQLLQQFDADQDGVFSPAESAQTAAGTLPNLASETCGPGFPLSRE